MAAVVAQTWTAIASSAFASSAGQAIERRWPGASSSGVVVVAFQPIANHHIGLRRLGGRQPLPQCFGLEHVVGVEENDPLRIGFRDASVASRRGAAIGSGHNPSGGLEGAGDRERAVGRAVVDDDHLDRHVLRQGALERRGKRGGCVVTRHNHRYGAIALVSFAAARRVSGRLRDVHVTCSARFGAAAERTSRLPKSIRLGGSMCFHLMRATIDIGPREVAKRQSSDKRFFASNNSSRCAGQS